MTDEPTLLAAVPVIEAVQGEEAMIIDPPAPIMQICPAPAEATTSTEPPLPDAKPEAKPNTNANAKRRKKEDDTPKEPLSEVILRRLTRISVGDTVLLKLPSDAIKAVTAAKEGLIHLGKYGSFPAAQLLGLHYDITYEIIATPASGSAAGPSTLSLPTTPASTATGTAEEEQFASASSSTLPNQGQGQGQDQGLRNKKKGKGKDGGAEAGKNALAWRNTLRPLRRQPLTDAVIDDITETNEFITDMGEAEKRTLSAEEINELRSEGLSAEEIIQRQMKAHEKFGLKTEFSKEKWRRRKEKKFYQTVHPLSPSLPNILTHYSERAPASILNLRADTLAQLLNTGNIRPGGRYMVVDDTGGLVTAAILERMGAEGRIMLFTDSDSPPGWGILQSMNVSERELKAVKWLNWMEMEEDYERAPPPAEDGPVKAKAAQRIRKHNAQVAELNATRNELHQGGWDGLILATSLSPISIISRLSRYLIGSSPIVVYSPYLQVLAELLNWSKRDPNFIHDTISESWERTYQVLPGRTHPMMNTSATGGYLWSAIRVYPAKYQPDSHQRFKRRKPNAKKSDAVTGSGAEGATDAAGSTDAAGADEVIMGTGQDEEEDNAEVEETLERQKDQNQAEEQVV